ncbi:MAG: flagellar hook-associated protein FlgK [Paracoccaceae bacterium]
MSLSGSLSNAMSGLNAASRAAEVVSSNVANSLTEGYGRRELEIGSRSVGGNGAGVQVYGVLRNVDNRIIAERRLSDASLGYSSAAASFYSRLEQTLGLPDDPNSVAGLLAKFESALIEAASRPDSEPRLQEVLVAAQGLTNKLNAASDQIQSLRMEADQDIGLQVAKLNDSLIKISELNQNIQTQLSAGHDANALMDQRQQIIDGISEIVPLRQVARAGGRIALFTTGGAILLDGKAAEVGFTPVGVIVPQMTIGTGALSGLTVNGRAVSTGPDGPLAGGSLAGMFAVRDELAPVAQQRLDAVARDLVDRFADPAVDSTLAASDPGLFTDAGLALIPANELGLAARLSVNSLIDPAAGGALWRIRDGLAAAMPGNVGDSTLILALADALTIAKIPVSGGFIGAARSAIGLAGDMMSLANAGLRSAESNTSFALAQLDTFKLIELQNGVDTDYEMQRLLMIEQAYAANARVISAIDEMINTVLGL